MHGSMKTFFTLDFKTCLQCSQTWELHKVLDVSLTNHTGIHYFSVTAHLVYKRPSDLAEAKGMEGISIPNLRFGRNMA